MHPYITGHSFIYKAPHEPYRSSFCCLFLFTRNTISSRNNKIIATNTPPTPANATAGTLPPPVDDSVLFMSVSVVVKSGVKVLEV